MASRFVQRMREAGVRIGIGESAQDKRARALAQHAVVMEEQERIERLATQARNRAAVMPVFADPGQVPDSVRARVAWPAEPIAPSGRGKLAG